MSEARVIKNNEQKDYIYSKLTHINHFKLIPKNHCCKYNQARILYHKNHYRKFDKK